MTKTGITIVFVGGVSTKLMVVGSVQEIENAFDAARDIEEGQMLRLTSSETKGEVTLINPINVLLFSMQPIDTSGLIVPRGAPPLQKIN